MSSSWRAKLDAGRMLLIDGGTGSELRRRGMPLRHEDVWSGLAALTHASVLRDVHADYIAAGARVITTNTFGTSRFVLEAAGLADRFFEINRRSVEAALAARAASGADDVAIAGSISCLPPRFDPRAYPQAQIEAEAYRELAELLVELGADFLTLEMMQDTEHAARACAAAAATGVPFWLGVSCRLGPDGRTLVTYDFPDVPFASVLEALLPYGPTVVCVMHSPRAAIVPALEEMRTRWNGPIGAYPEWPEPMAGQADSPQAFAQHARDWYRAGARVLGGCCGTTPAHIAALRAALESDG